MGDVTSKGVISIVCSKKKMTTRPKQGKYVLHLSQLYLEGGANGYLRSKIGVSNLEINKKIWVCQIFLDTQTDKTSLSITNVETFLSD